MNDSTNQKKKQVLKDALLTGAVGVALFVAAELVGWVLCIAGVA